MPFHSFCSTLCTRFSNFLSLPSVSFVSSFVRGVKIAVRSVIYFMCSLPFSFLVLNSISSICLYKLSGKSFKIIALNIVSLFLDFYL